MKTDVPAYIKRIRTGLGLTQEEFAKALSVSFPTVNRWENDKVKPLPLAMKAIQNLEQTGVRKIIERIEFKETIENKAYDVIFRGKVLYNSTDGTNWTIFQKIPRPEFMIGRPEKFMIGKGFYQPAEYPNDHWDNNGITTGNLGYSYIDDLTVLSYGNG